MSRRDTTDAILDALRSDLLSLRGRVSEQASELVLFRGENAQLRLEIEILRQQTGADRAALEAKVAALEAELARRKSGQKNSSNSFKPPSSDYPHDPKSERDRRAGKPEQPRSERGGRHVAPRAHRPLDTRTANEPPPERRGSKRWKARTLIFLHSY